MTHTTFLPFVATRPSQPPTEEHPYESALLTAIIDSPLQERPVLRRNAILMAVAQRRVNDMIRRNYFSHTDPDGYGPNFHVRSAGFPLPAYYSRKPDANNIESLAAGQATVAEVWEALQGSYGHRAHLFGLGSFFYAQTEIGVGYAVSGAYHYRHVWSIIIAEAAQVSGE
jgi:uncharacterized protein YkwD